MDLSEKARKHLGNDPAITPKEFLERFWSLRPHGNVEDAYIQAAWDIAHSKDFYGKDLTLDGLIAKYKDYLAMCRNQGRAARYIKGIQNWMKDRMYNSEFVTDDDEVLRKYT